MSEHAAILAAFDHARSAGLPAVMATVVSTRGSTYRKAGARMMLVGDGTRVGVVSGGCLEGDVTRRAWFLRSPGDAELVRYDTGTGDDATYEFGLGCRGVVEVLLERLATSGDVDPPIMRALRHVVTDRETMRLATVIRGESIGRRTPLQDGVDALGEDAIAEVIEPPVQLLVFGAGPDVTPLLRLARDVGWKTIVVSRQPRTTNVTEADRFIESDAGGWCAEVPIDARTAAVVMSHRMDDDAGYLGALVGMPVGYVGCLGPVSRTEALYDKLALGGIEVMAEFRARVHAPVGLDLGAEGPAEIALAIVAEIQASLAGASGARLRDRDGPIHADRSHVVTRANAGL